KPASRKAVLLLRHKIAYLFQNYALIDNETVEDNLKLALRYKKGGNPREEIQQALASVDLAGFQDRKVFSLSGGEQQRVAMARVILKPCELILADEPTGNLDENNANEIFSILSQMNKKGKTVIVATHSTDAIKYFDQVVNLESRLSRSTTNRADKK
ncbi:MAG: ATP-binding cassette domain-containing protein, partial [Eubacteriales bacterium]|nr:ATP-binding cassette domain-containing protein [Eubacteriales bacterium]